MNDEAQGFDGEPGWVAVAWGTARARDEGAAPEAWRALACAVAGMVCFGFVLGPLALTLGKTAKMAIAGDPERAGDGVASAAIAMGKIGLVLHLAVLLGGLGLAFLLAMPRE